MSEFDNLKDDAEKYAKDHPQQVHEGEQDLEHAAEGKLDNGGEGQDQDQAGKQAQADPLGRDSQPEDGERNQSQSS